MDMQAAKVLEWVIGRLGFVERRAERRRRDGLPDAREQQEIATLQWLVGFVGAAEPEAHAVAVARVAQQQRGRASTRSPETLIESLCRILECQPHEALARVQELAAKEKRTASMVANYGPALQRLADLEARTIADRQIEDGGDK